jgi:cardiolipin synthase
MPDRSATGELCAARARGTLVKVIVPGRANNHPLTRLASRRRYGTLLQAGVEIYEYQPGMIHTKSMTVDGVWVVVGSTNFDSRSFDLNDEVNLMALDAKLAAEVEREFAADLEKCKRITHEQWRRRSLAEQLAAMAGRLLERQE